VLRTTVRSQPGRLTTGQAAHALRGNLDRWDAGSAGPADRVWTGRAGLRRFVEHLQDSCGDPAELSGAYTFGWAMQAQAHLHGRFAQEFAQRSRQTHLLEVAASADRVVSAWSNVRLLSAHATRTDGITDLMVRRGADLVHAYEQLAVDWRLALSREWTDVR
jgi:hypothetical protein